VASDRGADYNPVGALFSGGPAMAITVETVYENGLLKPVQPLPLQEHDRVQLTIQPKTNWVQETYGIIKWMGSLEELERFAEDPELDYPPPPEEP
jgi:predicted DNA-binding antitoxin AbrB/MazE fold protein